jgi:hypothetical protein
MMPTSGLHQIAEPDVTSAVTFYAAQDYRVFSLTAEIWDRSTFFSALRAALPMDPPLGSDRSWDALSDSLWGGLERLVNRRIAILWRRSLLFEERQRAEYETACQVLLDVCELLGNPEVTWPTKEVVVLCASPPGHE